MTQTQRKNAAPTKGEHANAGAETGAPWRRGQVDPDPDLPDYGWTFLTNHAHVLVCVATAPRIRVRSIADRVGITERAVISILNDLVDTGDINRERIGRRNNYTLNPAMRLRHPLEDHATIRELLSLLNPEP